MLRRVGVNQCPTTAAPITSVTNLYLCPSHANSTGHELPRRSASFIAITCVCGRSISSCSTPVGHRMRSRSMPSASPRPTRICGGALRLVARCAGQFPLLPQPVGKDLHLRADRRLVVGKAGQVEPHKVILVRAHIAQQHRRRVQLRHDQVRRAVAIHIGRNQPARRSELHMHRGPERVAHIFKAAIAAIAKDAHLRAGAGFDNRRQVDPSVVVDIDRALGPIRAVRL